MVGTLVLIGSDAGLRFLRAGRSGLPSAVITGTDEDRGGPIPVLTDTEERHQLRFPFPLGAQSE